MGPGQCLLTNALVTTREARKEINHLTLETHPMLNMNTSMPEWSWIPMQTHVHWENVVWCWETVGELLMLLGTQIPWEQ